MEDELSGRITWDEGRYEMDGVMTLADGQIVKLTVDGMDETITEVAWNAIKFVIANEALMRRKIVASIFELYPDWVDGDTITPEELARRLTLEYVSIWTEGGGELSYTAKDMFGGHWVCAHFDANGEVENPELEG